MAVAATVRRRHMEATMPRGMYKGRAADCSGPKFDYIIPSKFVFLVQRAFQYQRLGYSST